MVVIDSTTGAKCDDGDSVRFIDFDGELLDYEIEEWNGGSSNSIVWVEVGSIWSSVDTQLYLYYNNTAATDEQDITGTWDSSFICVQHLNESSGHHLDSTSNNNDSTDTTVVKQGNATGMADGCDDFESGNTDYVRQPTVGDLNTFTIECWINPESLSANIEFIGKSSEFDGIIYTNGSTYFGMDAGGTCIGDAGDVDTGAWYYFVATSDGTDIHAILGNTTSGTVLGEGSGAATANLDSDYHIGNRMGAAVHFDGLIDEVRISNVERSDSYINATYHTINQTSGFLTIASETSVADTGDEPYPPDVVSEAITYNGYISGTTLTLNYTDGMGQRQR